MSHEALQESLSALIDNEADELEVRRILAAEAGGELHASWSRYQLARAALHREAVLPNFSVAAAVSAALADEPVPGMTSASQASRWTNGWARLAVAASVTVAVLGGVRLYNQDELAGAQLAQQAAPLQVTQPQTQGPAILAGYSESPQLTPRSAAAPGNDSEWLRQRYPHYLQQHAQQGGSAAADGTLPYARGASVDGR